MNQDDITVRLARDHEIWPPGEAAPGHGATDGGTLQGREQGWVAEQDGAVIGTIALTDETAGIACVHRLHVAPDHRRRGIGQTLIETCLRFARKSGYHVVMLAQEPDQPEARRLVRRNGFLHLAEGTPDATWMLTLRMAEG